MKDFYKYDNLPVEIEFKLEKGDNYEDIAREFETSLNTVFLLNPHLKAEKEPKPGDRIRLPLPKYCQTGNLYIIKKGESVKDISRKFKISEVDIYKNNPLLLVFGLRPGLPLCIPLQCKGDVYVVALRDSIFSIAVKHQVSVDAILKVNPGINPDFLVPGQKICIPKKK